MRRATEKTQFTGADQRTWDENWPELQLAVNTRVRGDHRTLAGIYNAGKRTGRCTQTPAENAEKLKEIFELVRRNMEKAARVRSATTISEEGRGNTRWEKQYGPKSTTCRKQSRASRRNWNQGSTGLKKGEDATATAIAEATVAADTTAAIAATNTTDAVATATADAVAAEAGATTTRVAAATAVVAAHVAADAAASPTTASTADAAASTTTRTDTAASTTHAAACRRCARSAWAAAGGSSRPGGRGGRDPGRQKALGPLGQTVHAERPAVPPEVSVELPEMKSEEKAGSLNTKRVTISRRQQMQEAGEGREDRDAEPRRRTTGSTRLRLPG
ncbi:uncharacterized protein LOC122319529 [Drosophila yakuba]|uniref:uncharacterized protein LOC122319529 n=1 Tax=Drosophila yakuba TaxID=7245 RepID=UPI001C89019B|nr:uncharacterized protein LOC122319529 [Drosophila yakuba]